jgi:DNA mismatch repair protein MutS2
VERLAIGDLVQTPLGKGVVREVRTNGRVLVVVAGRNILVASADTRLVPRPSEPARRRKPAQSVLSPSHDLVPPEARDRPRDVDLHGFVVDDALARAVSAINDALLNGASQLRLIHGRSGGRIRAALHRELRGIPSIRSFRLDPTNEGVTIVTF